MDEMKGEFFMMFRKMKTRGIIALTLVLAMVLSFVPNFSSRADAPISTISIDVPTAEIGETAEERGSIYEGTYGVECSSDNDEYYDWTFKTHVLGWSDSKGAHFEGEFQDGEVYKYTVLISGKEDNYISLDTKVTINGISEGSNFTTDSNGTKIKVESESDLLTYTTGTVYRFYSITYSFKSEEESEEETDATDTTSDDDTKTTDDTKTVTVTTKTYTILDGDKQSVAAESGKDLVIRADGALADFKELKIDGTVVDKAYYTLAEGSTIVTVKSAFLDTLKTGAHTLTFVYTDGEVSASFTTVETEVPETSVTTPTNEESNADTSPKTGDADMLIVGAFMMMALLGMIALRIGKSSVRKDR